MPPEVTETNCNWLCTGQEVFPAMLAAIDAAQLEICLETYIFAPGQPGESFRDALVRAAKRGLTVRVLLDAFGSYTLPANYWTAFHAAGGRTRLFNPLSLHRLGIRNHRKLLVCDEHVAFVGGFNIAPEYHGDGVTCGWCDVGLRIQGPLARQLAASFDEMYQLADFRQKPFVRFRRSFAKKTVGDGNEQLLLSGPGRGHSPIQQAVRQDLERARSAQIVAAYFLPARRLRRQLSSVSRRGGVVELILGAKSDVAVSRLAAQNLYRRLLKGGIQILEYQPQILHAKLVIIDDAVYVGSANFDLRSFHFNYELMVRFENKEMAAKAREVFSSYLPHCRKITLEEWRKSGTFWQRLKQRWAYWLLVRLDPYIAQRQWRSVPD